MDPRVLTLAVAMLLLAATPGCTSLVDTGDEADGETPASDDEPPVEECLSQTFHRNESQDAPRSAWIECRANVPGTNEQTMDCGAPEDAELRIKTNLTAGRVTLRVTDGADETVVEETYDDTEGEVVNVTMQPSDAEPGTWTLTGRRSEGFDGTYRTELFCPEG